MGKLLLVGLAWFIVAMLAPEVRGVLVIGAFCAFGGLMVGYQKGFAAKVELTASRLERQAEKVSMRTIEA